MVDSLKIEGLLVSSLVEEPVERFLKEEGVQVSKRTDTVRCQVGKKSSVVVVIFIVSKVRLPDFRIIVSLTD